MILRLLFQLMFVFSVSANANGILLLPKTSLAPWELGLIVNDTDPLSVEIADYYREKRGIPERNIIRVQFSPGRAVLSRSAFESVYEQVHAQTPDAVQAYALAWARPYRVGCMSITTAFATGYDESYCAKKLPDKPCGIGGESAYFTSNSRAPYRDFGLRPTMMLAALDIDEAKQLVDRGLASDTSFPEGTAYLLSTSDKSRTVRDENFDLIKSTLGSMPNVEVLEQDSLKDKHDVLFYFTGKAHVEDLDSLTFLPGAVADHLTSSGGHMKALGSGGQMSALRWLEAGATGSYGTVIEPCNFTAKFPNPGVLMHAYMRGESLIEAYWKSVRWPGEGLFIGEPLAAPFFRGHIEFVGDSVSFAPNQFLPGNYLLEAADFPVGPFRGAGRTVRVDQPMGDLTIDGLDKSYYRLAKIRVNSGFGLSAHTIGKAENISPEY